MKKYKLKKDFATLRAWDIVNVEIKKSSRGKIICKIFFKNLYLWKFLFDKLKPFNSFLEKII